jgi:hypothetical protein
MVWLVHTLLRFAQKVCCVQDGQRKPNLTMFRQRFLQFINSCPLLLLASVI